MKAILKSPVSNRCEIVFNSIMAKIKTNSRTQFVVEFHSSCLEDSRKKNFVDSSDNRSSGQHSCPEWSKAVIPTLYPMMSEHDYLSEQHLLLAIKSVDNDESYELKCTSSYQKTTTTKHHHSLMVQPYAKQQ
ncbi:Phosphatidylinositol 3 [Acropora cervicornis]|uniref:Phosphatidylinositol 3 n=1 Tax=Acropora cervicornis TaxID=6130 RepID=A0AAD9VGT4_ACRCE|nr:Phosphatidylinositol 3 [Acropora cervicornis]